MFEHNIPKDQEDNGPWKHTLVDFTSTASSSTGEEKRRIYTSSSQSYDVYDSRFNTTERQQSRRFVNRSSRRSTPPGRQSQPFRQEKVVYDYQYGYSGTDFLETTHSYNTRRGVRRELKSVYVRDIKNRQTFCNGPTGLTVEHANILNSSFPGYYDAAVAANKKIQEIDLNVLVAYAERRSTYKMISGNANKIVKALDHLQYENDSKAAAHALGVEYRGSRYRKSMKTVGPKWLELQYGWKPLLSDIHNVLILSNNARPPEFWVKSSKETEEVNITATYTSKVKRRITFKTRVAVIDPALVTLSSMGLINPLATAWEKTGYSFVFDWLLPVGDYLKSLTARTGMLLTDRSSTFTTVEEVSYREEPTPIGTASSSYQDTPGYTIQTDRTLVGQNAEGTMKANYKDRFLVFPDMPLPKLQNPTSLNHAISALALVEQRRLR